MISTQSRCKPAGYLRVKNFELLGCHSRIPFHWSGETYHTILL